LRYSARIGLFAPGSSVGGVDVEAWRRVLEIWEDCIDVAVRGGQFVKVIVDGLIVVLVKSL